jgi:hypothetical protein
MNARQIRAREAFLTLLSPPNDKQGCTFNEAKSVIAALDILGFGPIEVYVSPLVTGPGVVERVPLSEVERYGLEDELLNYACATPTLNGFNVAGLRRNFDQPADMAFNMMFAEFHPGFTQLEMSLAKLAMPGVAEAIQAHLAKGQAIALPESTE